MQPVQAGKTPGATPTFKLDQGTKSSNVDYNNIAPSVGLAWTPTATGGLLGALMGREGNFVIRGGYTRSFSRPGMNDFTSVFNANPGITITANREEGQGTSAPCRCCCAISRGLDRRRLRRRPVIR